MRRISFLGGWSKETKREKQTAGPRQLRNFKKMTEKGELVTPLRQTRKGSRGKGKASDSFTRRVKVATY